MSIQKASSSAMLQARRSVIRYDDEPSRRSTSRLRPSVMPLRTYARPKPSALGLRLGISASIVLKSNAYTKMASMRCGNHQAHTTLPNRVPFTVKAQDFDPRPVFHKKG
jgi:hypothetical protein